MTVEEIDLFVRDSVVIALTDAGDIVDNLSLNTRINATLTVESLGENINLEVWAG